MVGRWERGLFFGGAGDVSAGVAISHDMVVVADDEDNVLWVYEVGRGGDGCLLIQSFGASWD